MKGRGAEPPILDRARGAVVAGLPEGHNAPRYIWRCSKNDLIKSDGGTIAGILREWGSDGSTVSARMADMPYWMGGLSDAPPRPNQNNQPPKATKVDRASNTATIHHERITNEARE